MTKLEINPKYIKLREFVLSLPHSLEACQQRQLLHSGRNDVWQVRVEGVDLVVKSYRRITLINRYVYAHLRRSKAHRAYANAWRLKKLGVDTPEPIAAVDFCRRGRLEGSYYITALSCCHSAAVLNDYPNRAETLQPLMDSLTEFLYELHNRGVEHEDLNITNILYRQTPSGFAFELIDINRLRFRGELSERSRLRNLRRLTCGVAAYAYILDGYALRLEGRHDSCFQIKGLLARLFFDERQRAKHRVKESIKERFGGEH